MNPVSASINVWLCVSILYEMNILANPESTSTTEKVFHLAKKGPRCLVFGWFDLSDMKLRQCTPYLQQGFCFFLFASFRNWFIC